MQDLNVVSHKGVHFLGIKWQNDN